MGLTWSVADPWELWKAIAVALTGAFGVMGLLTTYKDKETGEMTVWGRINLGLILIAATGGILLQLHDAQSRAESSRQAALEAAASASLAATTATLAQDAASHANETATNTRRLIGDLVGVSQSTERSVANSRAAAEAGQTAASRTLGVARQTSFVVDASRAGLVRIERLLSPFNNPTIEISFDCGSDGAGPHYGPDEAAGVHLTIGGIDEPLYALYRGTGRIDESSLGCKIIAPLQVTENTGIKSYLDFSGRRLHIAIERGGLRPDKIGDVRVETSDGEFIILPRARTERSAGHAVIFLDYAFPAERDPRDIE